MQYGMSIGIICSIFMDLYVYGGIVVLVWHNNMNSSTAQKTVSEADSSAGRAIVPAKRSLAELVAPLERIAARSPSLVANHGAQFTSGGQGYELPRYLFIGPKGGDDTIRLGMRADGLRTKPVITTNKHTQQT